MLLNTVEGQVEEDDDNIEKPTKYSTNYLLSFLNELFSSDFKGNGFC